MFDIKPMPVDDISSYIPIPFANCQTKAIAPSPMPSACGGQKKKKEDNMNTNINMQAPVSEESKQRDYLLGELRNVQCTKEIAMEEAFGLIDDPFPRKAKDLIDRITSGKYVLKDEKTVRWVESALDYFTWRDPAKVRDDDGFQAAKTKMREASKPVERTIKIADPAKGLEALVAFEGTTFQ